MKNTTFSRVFREVYWFFNDFVGWIQKIHKLQCFFCPRLKNDINYNVFFVPDTKMLEITMVPPTAKPGVLDDISRPYKWFSNSQICGPVDFGVFFAHV